MQCWYLLPLVGVICYGFRFSASKKVKDPKATGVSPTLVSVDQSQQQRVADCTSLNAVLVLRCLSPLIDFTQSGQIAALRQQAFGLNSNVSRNTINAVSADRICQLYDDYQNCAPEVIRRSCHNFVSSVERVYDYVCSADVKGNFTQTFDCISVVESHLPAKLCQRNATDMLRDAAMAETKTDANRRDMQCEALRAYFQCAKDLFTKHCGRDAWIIKQETMMRSTAAIEANCSFVEETIQESNDEQQSPEELSKPACEGSVDHCSCKPGFVFEGSACKDVDECASNNGDLCSQKCINTFGSYKCLCDQRYYRLDSASNRCIRTDNDSAYIFFAHGQSIWNISINGDNYQLEKAGLQKTAMIDLDVQERRLYYVDIGANVIGRIHFDSAFAQTIQSADVDGTEGIALDWVNKGFAKFGFAADTQLILFAPTRPGKFLLTRKLYSARGSNLFVQEADGKYRKTLYKNVMKLPRALAIFPHKGYLFASDWGQNSFIARANTDGSKFKKIIDKGLVWPNGLAIDYYAEKLYWADAYVDIIESSNFDGSQRRTILQDSSSVPHVFGLSIHDDSMYWTDWTYRGILKASKFHGENVTLVAQAALLPYGIKLYHKAQQPALQANPCASAQCSQLCLFAPNKNGSVEASCKCADGFEMLENGTCALNCTAREFSCGPNELKCVSKRFKCDGTNQCVSGADEQDCGQRVCPANQFQCHSRVGCLQLTQVCDGVGQCNDSSDEKFC